MKSLSIITCDQQNVIKFTHLISKEGENNKGFVKYVFWKVFKKFVKPLMSPFLIMLQTFFLLKENSNENWALKWHSKFTQRTLKGQSKGTWALGHTRHLRTWAPKHLRYSFTRRALGHSRNLGTWALRHSGTGALNAFGALYLADSFFPS